MRLHYVTALLSVSGPAVAFQFLNVPMPTRAQACSLRRASPLAMSHNDYLSSISVGTVASAGVVTPTQTVDQSHQDGMATFAHAPLSFFSLDKLTPKGPRKGADIGTPHDATRPLAKVGAVSAGSWWCAEGGWPSPAKRATTEVFFVFSGHGCLTDTDGTRHYFGPGCTVTLPKGWSGRWDVLEDIHKVWFVHDHPNVEDTCDPIRAVITHYTELKPQHIMSSHGLHPVYSAGPTTVSSWTCKPGSFFDIARTSTQWLHVVEGVFFISNADGSAQRCVAGDTIVVPKGWTGSFDVIESVLAVTASSTL